MITASGLTCSGIRAVEVALRHLAGHGPDPCEIPPPCWVPRELGARCTRTHPGAAATITLLLENGGATARPFVIESSGDDAGLTISPPAVTIGPLERASVTAELPIAAGAVRETERELLIWVRGCHDHVLRWTVKTAAKASRHPETVHVYDRHELTHNWYDHFYCTHPCRGTGP